MQNEGEEIRALKKWRDSGKKTFERRGKKTTSTGGGIFGCDFDPPLAGVNSQARAWFQTDSDWGGGHLAWVAAEDDEHLRVGGPRRGKLRRPQAPGPRPPQLWQGQEGPRWGNHCCEG